MQVNSTKEDQELAKAEITNFQECQSPTARQQQQGIFLDSEQSQHNFQLSQVEQSKYLEEEYQICWICLEAGQGEKLGELIQPCQCPTYAHRSCLARWQLQQAGKSEEKCCRFCQAELLDWRESLTPKQLRGSLTVVQPIMVVFFDGLYHRIPVAPGRVGLRQFTDRIRRLFNLPDGVDVNVTFGCKEPMTGQPVTLEGIGAYDAAVHCASVAAAERLHVKSSRSLGATSSLRADPTRAYRPSLRYLPSIGSRLFVRGRSGGGMPEAGSSGRRGGRRWGVGQGLGGLQGEQEMFGERGGGADQVIHPPNLATTSTATQSGQNVAPNQSRSTRSTAARAASGRESDAPGHEQAREGAGGEQLSGNARSKLRSWLGLKSMRQRVRGMRGRKHDVASHTLPA